MSYKNKIYLQGHNNIFDSIIIKKRIEISEIVNKLILKYDLQSVTDIGTTSDNEFKSSNLIIKNLKKLIEFKSISNQEINSEIFNKTLNKSITSNGSQQWFDSYGVIKSATTTTSSGTIATSTNAISVGPVTVGSANTLTIHGEWRIV